MNLPTVPPLSLTPFDFGAEPSGLLRVQLESRNYPICIGDLTFRDCLEVGQWGGELAVVVTNPLVDALYGDRLEEALLGRFKRVDRLLVRDGEQAKDWQTLQYLLSELAARGADRQTVLFALGGGVVGDITGFVAAIYMRGVRFVQVPTTLLAQVDSSVGGKNGINLPQGKNLVGTFYQPEAVWADISVLDSLSPREFAAGLAEVIKYGPIADPAFYAWLEQNIEALLRRDRKALTLAIRRACEIKAAVVGADEHESGVRAILNFGHTFGHALEAGLGYGQLLHGEAVGLGMLMAMELSVATVGLPAEEVPRLRELLQRAELPIKAPCLIRDDFLRLMQGDKKSAGGQIRYVLIPRVGQACVRYAPEDTAWIAISAHTA
ncbi:3-dehydroquinate synthase [Inhella sp.]|uniref:3-dehydroquinate synthase n=1 Tax=Inhella sp. TaxID=1921806 RepID=UPI0035AE4AAA